LAEKDRVQDFRDLVRPIVILILVSSFVVCVMWMLHSALAVMVLNKKFELSAATSIVALIGMPLTTVMGYMFGKSSKKDSASG